MERVSSGGVTWCRCTMVRKFCSEKGCVIMKPRELIRWRILWTWSHAKQVSEQLKVEPSKRQNQSMQLSSEEKQSKSTVVVVFFMWTRKRARIRGVPLEKTTVLRAEYCRQLLLLIMHGGRIRLLMVGRCCGSISTTTTTSSSITLVEENRTLTRVVVLGQVSIRRVLASPRGMQFHPLDRSARTMRR